MTPTIIIIYLHKNIAKCDITLPWISLCYLVTIIMRKYNLTPMSSGPSERLISASLIICTNTLWYKRSEILVMLLLVLFYFSLFTFRTNLTRFCLIGSFVHDWANVHLNEYSCNVAMTLTFNSKIYLLYKPRHHAFSVYCPDTLDKVSFHDLHCVHHYKESWSFFFFPKCCCTVQISLNSSLKVLACNPRKCLNWNDSVIEAALRNVLSFIYLCVNAKPFGFASFFFIHSIAFQALINNIKFIAKMTDNNNARL